MRHRTTMARLEDVEKATAERTKGRANRFPDTPDGREALLRKNWAAARAMYEEDPEGYWALRYIITAPEPPAELIQRARNGELSLPADVIVFGQSLLWDWLQAQSVRIEN